MQQNLTYNDIVQSLQVLNLIADVTKAVLSENIDLTWDRLAKLKKFFPVKFKKIYFNINLNQYVNVVGSRT